MVMRRLLTAVILLLVAGSTYAANFAPPGTDYSVAYLSQIFGTVGNVLQGSSGQVLGKVFEIFNKGLLVVAALYLGVVTVQTALRAAGEGSFMGQNRSVPMLLLRIAAGFALIVPSSTTGYSLLQDIYMKIVVEGVGLADQVWDAGLQYMQYGGQLYIQPKNLSNDSHIVANTIGSTTPVNPQVSPLPPVTQIFQDLVCTYKTKDWLKAKNPKSNPQSYHPVFSSSANGYVYFPGAGNDPTAGGDAFLPISPSYHSQVQYQAVPACGYAQVYSLPGFSPSPGQGAAMQSISYQALKQLVLSLEPAAQLYIQLEEHPGAESNEGREIEIEKQIFSAIVAYGNLITPYQTMVSTSNSGLTSRTSTAQATADAENQGQQCYLSMGSLLTGAGGASLQYAGPNCSSEYSACFQCNYTAADFLSAQDVSNINHKAKLGYIPQAEAQGWIMAGSFYWNVEQSNQALAQQSIGKLRPVVAPPTTSMFNSYGNPPGATLTAAANFIIWAGHCQPGSCTAAGIAGLWNQYVGTQTNQSLVLSGSTSGLSTSTGSLHHDIINAALDHFGNLRFRLAGSQDYNPITVMMTEGNYLLEDVTKLWILMISISTFIAVGAGICDGTGPGGLMFKAALTWIKSIMMLITSIMLVPGAILAYYIPMYPFVLFTFAAVGWFLLVIEGMAAAPLVCVGMTHPEGHDFLGKAEQAMMLFLSIFVRPALMIIGLLGSMVISFVAFKMLIVGFAGVLSSLMPGAGGASNVSTMELGGSGNGLLTLLKYAMIMLIFGMLTMELIEQCYKLIYQLPNQIMLWIGGPQTGQDFAQQAQAIKSGVSTGAQTAGQAGQSAQEGAAASGEALGAAIKDKGGKAGTISGP